MATYKYHQDELMPIEQWHQQQANLHQQTNIMPPQNLTATYRQAASMMTPPDTHNIEERSTPITRAQAFSIRYINIGIILLLLSLGVVWVAAGTVIVSHVVALFGTLALIAFIALTKYDYQNTTYNNERHRISALSMLLDNESARLHERELEQLRLNYDLRIAQSGGTK